VGFAYGELDEIMRRSNPAKLQHAYNSVDGEDIFFIAHPGLGLWAHKSRMGQSSKPKIHCNGN
jgi:hypothetical protein